MTGTLCSASMLLVRPAAPSRPLVHQCKQPPDPPRPVPAPLLQDSLLADDSVSGYSLGLSSSPTASEGSDHFPCIADELEEQAKQLEEGW
jgi:hypothetical protein